ncbi:MAG: AsmA family protein, partial [Gemmobacter sp.]
TGVILLGGMIVLMPKDGVARIAAERFSAATGRAITISGDLKPRLWPVLGLRSGPVEVANADWGKAPWLLRAEAMDIGLDLSELLGGRIRVTGFILSAPDLVLERAQDGRVNWALGPAPKAAEAAPDSAASPLPFVLERANIRDGRLRILDHGDGTETVIEDLRIDTAIPDLQGPVELQASGSHNGQAASLTARIADLAAFIEGDPVGLDLDLASGAATFGFAGEADLAPLAAEGSVTADLTDVASLAQLIGQPAPQLPEGWGQDSLTLTAAARLTADGGLHLRDALLSADGQTVVGTLDWTPRPPRPHLAAMLSTGLIRLAATGAGRSADLTQTGWSETPFDLGLLSALDADVTLATEGFDFGRGALGPSTVRIALDSSRAV